MSARPAHVFPLSAIVGQETLRTALLLNAIDPRVGGVLIRGEKGTAKSTAVRALASVLPQLEVNDGCRFSCDPSDPGSWCVECRERRSAGPLGKSRRDARVVELPVSATEDRLVGTLDLEHALKHGERVFEPGLLASANRSILYVDEVNLLDDHLVDTLLDAAAMGVNTVEREGVSFSHPARFILVGTMNPEEGDLRPQLLDRFGLCVDIKGVREPESRVEIIRRRRAFEHDPEAFAEVWGQSEQATRDLIRGARLRLETTGLPDEIMYAIANLALTAGVDGHRADNVMARAAVALAALDGRTEATLNDVATVAPLVLAHRVRRTLFDEPKLDATALAALVNRSLGLDGDNDEEPSASGSPGEGQTSIFDSLGASLADSSSSSGISHGLEQTLDRTRRALDGRRQQTVSADRRGRYVRAEQSAGDGASGDIALDATIRAAAPHQGDRSDDGGLAISVGPDDVRHKIRTRKVGASIVFCVDASGSMGAANRIDAAKGAVLSLLGDAYEKRDRVAVVSFRGDTAEVVLAPTGSVELAKLRLKSLPTGGATPLAAGILRSLELLAAETRRRAETVPWLVIVTDGRANIGVANGSGSEDALKAAARIREASVNSILIDTASNAGGGRAAREIARAAGGDYVHLESLEGSRLSRAVRDRI